MLQFEELRLRLLGHEDALKDLADALGLEKMKKDPLVTTIAAAVPTSIGFTEEKRKDYVKQV